MMQTNKQPYRTTIGGQALIEGLMMIGPQKTAMTVRLKDGRLYREIRPSHVFGRWGKTPFVRGMVRLVTQVAIGFKALSRAADLNMLEPPIDHVPMTSNFGQFDQVNDDSLSAVADNGFVVAHFNPDQSNSSIVPADQIQQSTDLNVKQIPVQTKRKSDQWLSAFAILLGVVLGLGLFVVLPNLLIQFLSRLMHIDRSIYHQTIILNLFEGILRILILFGYIWLTTRSKAIARTWQYHGAEHKTIACYEHHEPLTVEHVRRYSRFHPRCGTSFLFIVVFISTLLFAFIGWYHPIVNLIIRLMCIPIVAGIAFELQRWMGANECSKCGRLLSKPGLWLQKMTTQEPDDEMLAVAIDAMKAVIPDEDKVGSDDWLGSTRIESKRFTQA